jgi:aquaporin Z
MKKYLVEFIGTFFLVFTVGATVIPPGVGLFAPFAIGAALMVMIFAGGHISGGHFNPAVTFAVWIRGHCPTRDVIPYWIAQIAAAVLAAGSMHFFKPEGAAQAMVIGVKAALLAEFIFTFALAWVVLNTATAKGTKDNSFYGLAIGMTVMTGAYAVGGISGGAFNPAVATGVTLMGLSGWGHLWVFFSSELLAAAAAAFAFKFVNGGD